MPVGAANLFSATDPKLAIYDYASSFFGGVAPLVSVLPGRSCLERRCTDHELHHLHSAAIQIAHVGSQTIPPIVWNHDSCGVGLLLWT